ncbi:MAG: DUF4476 domain-containing protein [Chitinophagales bacterium]
MRSFFSLLLLAFSSMMVHAQSNLTIFSQEGEKFWVVLNGIRQNDEAETNVKITELIQPNYKLKVIFENKALPEIDKNLFLPEQAADVTYNITKNRKGEYVVRYVSDVPIAQAPPPAPEQAVMSYSTAPRPVVRKSVTVTEHRSGNPTRENVSVTVNTPVGGMDIHVNDGWNSSSTTTTTTYVEEPAYVLPGYNGPIGCPIPMSQQDFDAARNSIASKDWDETRLSIAKQILGSNCLLSSHVSQIMQVFGWEETKLDFAKFAYGRTYDIGNYFKPALYNCFSIT